MKKPKILFLTQVPPPIHGSSMVTQSILENKAVQQTFDIDLVETQLAFSLKDIGQFHIKKVWNALKTWFLTFKKLLLNSYDLSYITLSPMSFAFYKDALLVLLLKIFSVPYVIHLHGKGIENEAKNSFKKRIYQFVFKNSEVIVLAEPLKQDIAAVHHGPIHVLPNGIPEIPNTTNTEKSTEPLTFIFLSNLFQTKGVLTLMDAAKILKTQTDQPFKLKIVGADGDVTAADLKERIENEDLPEIEVTGPLYGDDKFDALSRAHVFVFPSQYANECFPLSILEAMQSGLAVICSTVGGIPAMVEPEKNALYVSPDSPQDIADKMMLCLDDSAMVKSMGANNQKRFSEKFTSDIFIQNFIKIIQQVL